MDRSDVLRDDWLQRPKPERFGPDHPGFGAALVAHDAAVSAGHDGYIDPSSGLFVMTAQYLADQGRCCDCGCRHCPFP